MRIRRWQSFAANNSGDFTIVGRFVNADAARRLLEELEDAGGDQDLERTLNDAEGALRRQEMIAGWIAQQAAGRPLSSRLQHMERRLKARGEWSVAWSEAEIAAARERLARARAHTPAARLLAGGAPSDRAAGVWLDVPDLRVATPGGLVLQEGWSWGPLAGVGQLICARGGDIRLLWVHNHDAELQAIWGVRLPASMAEGFEGVGVWRAVDAPNHPGESLIVGRAPLGQTDLAVQALFDRAQAAGWPAELEVVEADAIPALDAALTAALSATPAPRGPEILTARTAAAPALAEAIRRVEADCRAAESGAPALEWVRGLGWGRAIRWPGPVVVAGLGRSLIVSAAGPIPRALVWAILGQGVRWLRVEPAARCTLAARAVPAGERDAKALRKARAAIQRARHLPLPEALAQLERAEAPGVTISAWVENRSAVEDAIGRVVAALR